MSNLNSLTNQLDWCKKTENYLLKDLEHSLRRSVGSVDVTMGILRQALMVEQMNNILPFQEVFNKEADKLWKLIHEKDLPYIQKQMEYLRTQIEEIENGTDWITRD